MATFESPAFAVAKLLYAVAIFHVLMPAVAIPADAAKEHLFSTGVQAVSFLVWVRLIVLPA
eukprot:1021929-Karenia_brevis.AAC.1